MTEESAFDRHANKPPILGHGLLYLPESVTPPEVCRHPSATNRQWRLVTYVVPIGTRDQFATMRVRRYIAAAEHSRYFQSWLPTAKGRVLCTPPLFSL